MGLSVSHYTGYVVNLLLIIITVMTNNEWYVSVYHIN